MINRSLKASAVPEYAALFRKKKDVNDKDRQKQDRIAPTIHRSYKANERAWFQYGELPLSKN
jgi:hypothetical protein